MATFFEQAVRIYEGIRRYAPPVHTLVRGTGRISFRAYAKLKRFRLPPEQPHNYRYLLDMYEPGTTKVIKSLLKPGMSAVDVGAHIGYYSRLFARLVGERGRVYAFEPNPKTFAILVANTKVFPNVTRFNMAVLDEEKEITLYQSVNSATDSVWAASVRGGPSGSFVVNAVALDDILTNVRVHLVKIDVEGSELEVLCGMQSVLSRSSELTLIVECNPSCLIGRGLNCRKLFETLRGLDFQISGIDELTGTVKPLNFPADLDRLLERRRKYINLLCRRE